MDASPRRKVGLGMLALGILAMALHAFVVPPTHAFEEPCDEAGRALGNGWVHIRGPQLGAGVIRYDQEADRTLVVPGCSHEHAGIAIWVAGDQRPMTSQDRLVLAPHGVTGESAGSVPYNATGRAQTLTVVDGSFQPVPFWARWWALAMAFVLLPVGAYLLLRRDATDAAWTALPAVAGLLGGPFGFFLNELIPLLMYGALVGFALVIPFAIAGFIVLARRPSQGWKQAIGVALVAFATATVVTVLAIGDSIPNVPVV